MFQKYSGGWKSKYIPSNEIVEFGNITFKFNSLGYRSEEYNPNAKKHIFVCGCSWTYGSGLHFQDTWSQHFKKIFTEKLELKLEDVNILNFAAEGHSNDCITRTVLSQCSKLKPDLLVIYFTMIKRTEYISEKDILIIGPWTTDKKKACYQPIAEDFYSYYTDELGFINTVKNMLLVQFFCKQNNIPYIFSFVDINKFNDEKFAKNPVCSQFMDLIDKEYLCDFKLDPLDLAADKNHPGPRSNKLFAEKLFKFYEERIKNKR